MSENENLGCTVYVDTAQPKQWLYKTIGTLTMGTWTIISPAREIYGAIISTTCEICVSENDEFDVNRKKSPDAFLYYRFLLDIEPRPQVSREDYLHSIALLLEGLWGQGCLAVASCDFEQELPRKGGYNWPPE